MIKQLRRNIQLDRMPIAAAGIMHKSAENWISLSFLKV